VPRNAASLHWNEKRGFRNSYSKFMSIIQFIDVTVTNDGIISQNAAATKFALADNREREVQNT